MGYGKLSSAQARIVAKVVKGQTVIDLGAGDLQLSHELLTLGAQAVTAVEKEELPQSILRLADPRVKVVRAYIKDLHGQTGASVAFLSWPANYPILGLDAVIAKTPIVVYLGKNTDGTSCGTSRMFQRLLPREVVAYVPEFKNTLIVYGPKRIEREPYGEELAALTSDEKWCSFEDVERATQKSTKK